jgi:hypothetical protein
MTPRRQSAVRHRFEEWWEVESSSILPPTVPKQWVLSIVERIAGFDPITPQLQQTQARRRDRKRLEHISSVTDAWVTSILGLQNQAPDVARQLEVGDLVELMTRFRDATERHILPLPPSGGGQDERIQKARNDLSAFSAFHVLRRPDVNIVPSLTDGPYITLAEAFVNIATGSEANLYHVCRKVLRWQEERAKSLYEKIHPEQRVRRVSFSPTSPRRRRR